MNNDNKIVADVGDFSRNDYDRVVSITPARIIDGTKNAGYISKYFGQKK